MSYTRSTERRGTLYLLHFERKLKHAGHYLGFVPGPFDALCDRIAQHRAGTGARLTQVTREQGIRFVVSRVWTDKTRSDERKLKNQKNSPRLCPICRGEDQMHEEEEDW
jgi:predicted GIY-YIG superfamily endonuclease